MKLLTYDPAKKKKVLVGEIIGDTLFRWVQPEHFMQVVGGYGIQEIAFQQILKERVKMIILKATHTEKRWEADVETWKYHGRVMDYGNGKQRFLSMKYMRTHELPQPEPETGQRRLFNE